MFSPFYYKVKDNIIIANENKNNKEFKLKYKNISGKWIIICKNKYHTISKNRDFFMINENNNRTIYLTYSGLTSIINNYIKRTTTNIL